MSQTEQDPRQQPERRKDFRYLRNLPRSVQTTPTRWKNIKTMDQEVIRARAPTPFQPDQPVARLSQQRQVRIHHYSYRSLLTMASRHVHKQALKQATIRSLIHPGRPKSAVSHDRRERPAGLCLRISLHGLSQIHVASPRGMSSFILRRQFSQSQDVVVQRETLATSLTKEQPIGTRNIHVIRYHWLRTSIVSIKPGTRINTWRRRCDQNSKQETSERPFASYAVMRHRRHRTRQH